MSLVTVVLAQDPLPPPADKNEPAGAALIPPLGRSILEAGAVPDGKTLNTAVINRVIAETSQAGGGTVYVPPGIYLTGTIYLKSRVTLHLANGAVLLGSVDLQDYPENPPPYPNHQLEFGRYSLIFAAGQHDLAIVGQGKIHGQGDHPNFTKKDLIARGWSSRDAYLKRPYGMCFIQCQRVQVRGITFENIAFWCQHYLDCDDVVVDGVTADSWKRDYNNDGIDIDSSRNVRVSNCNFRVGDDAICLKAAYRDCENITVTNCTASSMANGVKFGTASYGGFRNIAISNITFNSINAAGLALEIVDGGTMDGVSISNLTMTDVATAIFIRLGDRGRRWTTDQARPGIGVLRNVSINNVVANLSDQVGDGRPLACSITGLPDHPAENISITNLKITTRRGYGPDDTGPALGDIGEHANDYPENNMFGPLPAYGFYCRHVRDLTLRNIDVRFEKTDYRSALAFDDVQNLEVDGLKSRAMPGSKPVILLNDTYTAMIRGCTAPEGPTAFLRIEGKSTGISVIGNDLTRTKAAISLGKKLPPAAVFASGNRE
ncbi:MAG: glycosyl hydrolase family 28 protein [Opitutaceae bacterium]|nr:glycosyl hydrolase family 28 protein [Opitutaceae bacterium]